MASAFFRKYTVPSTSSPRPPALGVGAHVLLNTLCLGQLVTYGLGDVPAGPLGVV